MNYEVKLQQFSGPLEKLLELIEQKKLEVTELSLEEVTGDFLQYVKSLGGEVPSIILADFLVTASKLVLLKSKVLLPSLELTVEEESEIKDLEYRLKIYREFAVRGASSSGGQTASQYFLALWNRNLTAFGRPFLAELGASAAVFYPPKDLRINDLTKAIKNLVSALQALFPETKKITSTIITLEEKIDELLSRFHKAAVQSFQNIAQQKSRTEIIVVFLAILHLLKEQTIRAEQEEQFGDIIIKKSQ